MRTIEHYRAKALKSDEVADETAHPELKRCYRDLALLLPSFGGSTRARNR